jgi:hypothetical protein
MSMRRPSMTMPIRPSCGSRFSEMSRSARILIRETRWVQALLFLLGWPWAVLPALLGSLDAGVSS